jgi:serine/threonine-protein kinase
MTEKNWHDIETLFDAALDRPVEERLDWLRSVCTDPEIFREVSALLRAADRAEDFLVQPAGEVASTLIIDAHDGPSESENGHELPALPAQRIGRYRILKRIGWGGTGAVYLGERADGEFTQRVAIKLLRDDRMSRTQQARFLAERQILASLNHPDIARLLDGGVMDEDIPYIVMEFIDGMPIDRYCDVNRLSVADRLRLFQRVCAAVQYAHSQLVVHRDVKPSNVMVTTDGHVKLVDFGIAKLLDAETDRPVGPRPTLHLTPEYASPEQVRGDAVTAVSDVYSLGVLLYQLLIGRRPYDIPGSSATQIVRVVCEVDPAPPSERAHEPIEHPGENQPASAPEIASTRGLSTDALVRALRGDLDTIVMKSLRKEPSRRYQSVESFADDIGRFLDSRPITARRDSLAYRATMYVRRNRLMVAASLLVAVALIGGLAVSMWQSAERARQAERAMRTTAFMRDMLAGFDPNARPEELKHVEQILDMGARRLHDDLSAEPDLSAEIAAVLGDLYEDYGMYGKARELFELSLAQRAGHTPKRDHALADVTLKLAWVVNKMGDHDAAHELMLRSLDLSRSAYGERSDQVGDALDGLAIVHLNLGEIEEARSLLVEALDIFRARHGNDHVRVAGIWRHLAYVNQRLHLYPEADSLYRLALDGTTRNLGADHTDVAQTLHDHGSLLVRMNRESEGEDYMRRALEIRRERLGNGHPQVAQSLSHLGLLMMDRGRFDEAEEMLREALEIRRSIFGERHITFAHTINQLSQLYHARGNRSMSDSLLTKSIGTYRELLGTQNVQTLAALQIWGRRLADRGSHREAERVFREVLEGRNAILGDRTLATTESMLRLGATLLATGNLEESEMHLARALEIRNELYGVDHERTLEVQVWYGKCLTQLGRYSEAERVLTGAAGLIAENASIADDLRRQARDAVAALYASWPTGSS